MEESIALSLSMEERFEEIRKLLDTDGRVRVSDLSRRFNVSEVTIRNDLKILEEQGMLKKTHGGAISIPRVRLELPSLNKKDQFSEEKKAIGLCAAAMIQRGDTVLLDTGSTTLRVAMALGALEDVTVVVNDLALALVLNQSPGIELIVIGGNVRKSINCMVGPIACDVLSGLYVDKAILGTNGLSVKKGLTTPDLLQAATKKMMIEVAKEVIVVADHSKLGRTSFVEVAPVEKIDVLITDEMAPKEIVKRLQELGVDVQIVGV